MNTNNIIVNSKNRASLSSSSVNVELNTPLICGENEYFTVNIVSFHMIKSFYAIQTNLNSVFYIVLSNEVETNEYIRNIPSGNYNVSTLLKTLKELCFGLIEIEYNKTLNKFEFSRVENENTDGYDLFIRCVNCGTVLGFENNIDTLIPIDKIVSDTFVNISGYSSLLIKLNELSLINSYMNLNNDRYEINKLIGIIDIASVMPMDSIILNNDCTKYKINDKIISQFSIDITNEYNSSFPQMSDYILNLSFEKHSLPMDFNIMFNTYMTRFNDLMFYISYLFQYLGISKDE